MNTGQFGDGDFVYVDPEQKTIVDHVKWDKNGEAVPMEWSNINSEKDDANKSKEPQKRRRKRYYPWGTYKTMSKIYKLEGKKNKSENANPLPLEEAIEKLNAEPYWD